MRDHESAQFAIFSLTLLSLVLISDHLFMRYVVHNRLSHTVSLAVRQSVSLTLCVFVVRLLLLVRVSVSAHITVTQSAFPFHTICCLLVLRSVLFLLLSSSFFIARTSQRESQSVCVCETERLCVSVCVRVSLCVCSQPFTKKKESPPHSTLSYFESVPVGMAKRSEQANSSSSFASCMIHRAAVAHFSDKGRAFKNIFTLHRKYLPTCTGTVQPFPSFKKISSYMYRPFPSFKRSSHMNTHSTALPSLEKIFTHAQVQLQYSHFPPCKISSHTYVQAQSTHFPPSKISSHVYRYSCSASISRELRRDA